MADYISAFKQDGTLEIKNTDNAPSQVNLNSKYFQGKVPSNFVQTVASGATGVYQNGAKLEMKNETVELDDSSTVKFGNIIIQSSGNGLLIGLA